MHTHKIAHIPSNLNPNENVPPVPAELDIEEMHNELKYGPVSLSGSSANAMYVIMTNTTKLCNRSFGLFCTYTVSACMCAKAVL